MTITIRDIDTQAVHSYIVDEGDKYEEWNGSSCTCVVGKQNNLRYLIKKFIWSPEDSLDEAHKLHHRIGTVIQAYHEAAIRDNIPYNYLMRAAYIGQSLDGETFYQVFPHLNGKVLQSAEYPTTDVAEIKCVLNKFIHLLFSLKIICENFNHLDIKPSNIYERADSGIETKYEIFDFGSMQTKEELQRNAQNCSFKSVSSRPYYLAIEEKALGSHYIRQKRIGGIICCIVKSSCSMFSNC